MRAAVLVLLAERPMHGYQMLQELSARTGGRWRPSPGSLYPALQLLEDAQLLRSTTIDGRRQFELTESGRAECSRSVTGPPPWAAVLAAVDPDDAALDTALRQLSSVVDVVAQSGSPAQKARTGMLLRELRRDLYLLLAGEPTEPPA